MLKKAFLTEIGKSSKLRGLGYKVRGCKYQLFLTTSRTKGQESLKKKLLIKIL